MSGVLEYDTTPGNNTSINSIGIQGSNSVLNFDNGLRQLLADIASQITRRVGKSANYTALKADHKTLFEFTAAATLSLTAAATLTSGWCCIVKANGGAVTIDPASSEQVDGANTKSIPDTGFAFIYCTGSAFVTIAPASKLMDIAALAVTDGNIIVGDGTTWVAESGATALASLGAQAQGDVLDDLNTLGASTADGEFLVATGAGALAWESGATARASMGLGSIATQAANSVNIDGGAIDGTPIGSSSASTGAFTTITASSSITSSGAVTSSQNFSSSGTNWVCGPTGGTGGIYFRPEGVGSTTNQTVIDTNGNMTINGTLTVTG